MSRGLLTALGVVLVAIVVLVLSAFFTVDQRQQALVLQFGEPKRIIKEPGLKMKYPFIQDVVKYDRRILPFDAAVEEVILSDQKRLVVDAYARYKIVDPLKFYQTVRDERQMGVQLQTIVNSSLRQVLGTVPLITVVSGERANLMTTIRDLVDERAKSFGIQVIDVRLKRADLPEANSQAIYRRMQTEREREAREARAEGAELAQRVRARADREKVVLIAEAQRDAQRVRGEGEAISIKIFADAFGQDIEFFNFYRSMEAYRQAFGDDDTTMVLSPDSEFFRFFGKLGTLTGNTGE